MEVGFSIAANKVKYPKPCMLSLQINNKMRYEDKFIKHKATKQTPKWNEIVANIEFSEGDLMEL